MIEVRRAESEIKIQDGDKVFYYTRDDDGKLRIAKVEGMEEKEGLLDRLLRASGDNCVYCMKAEMWDYIIKLFMADLGGALIGL